MAPSVSARAFVLARAGDHSHIVGSLQGVVSVASDMNQMTATAMERHCWP